MIYVWDLDGVLCAAKHREYLVKGQNYRYDEFHEQGIKSPLIKNNAELFRITAEIGENVILTGRTDNWSDETVHWLGLYELEYSMLLMRPVGELKPSPVWKLESLIKTFTDVKSIAMVFDDRADIITAMIQNGIPGVVLNEE